MMAGAGVSVGGAGMLRARRRDVSVKPNRKLDRKSSRGMIYENEELRLRTININAEVEQGQNDIKKLRRENEQLRREIWSLRDEYDKLEEILKCQKNQEDSEDYEDRSEAEDKDDDEEAEDCSDYSVEEAEEDCDEVEKDVCASYETEGESNKEERLENAENQKISSEKMNSINHRLHVEFDDLSVVDEEDELKKDKERKDNVSSEEREGTKITKETDLIRINSRNGYQCFSPRYGSPEASGSANPYYTDRPFVYPNADGTEFTEILLNDSSSMLLTQCPRLYDDTFPQIGNYESANVTNATPDYNENFRRDQMTYGNQIGWQSNIFAPGKASTFNSPGQSDRSIRSASTARAPSFPQAIPIDDRIDSSARILEPPPDNVVFSSLLQRRNSLLRRPISFYGETIIPSCAEPGEIEVPTSADLLIRNGWDFGNAKMFHEKDDCKSVKEEARDSCEPRETTMKPEFHRVLEDSTIFPVGTDRPKHFFAPLSTKIQHDRQDSGDKNSPRTMNLNDLTSAMFLESFGTGKSSASDRTNSTVISGRHFQPHSRQATLTELFTDSGEKGLADVCVNGGIAANTYVQSDCRNNEERSYKSSNNLLIDDNENSRDNSSSRHGSNNPLVKSVSCQDLISEPLQNSLYEMTRTLQTDGKSQKFTKSDNTLDNPIIESAKPFRSQLNVTLKFPRNINERDSPEIPEIPKLPTIDYRLFSNPFLKTFEGRGGIYDNYDIHGSGQVIDRDKIHQQRQPPIDYSSAVLTQSFARRLNTEESTVKPTRTCTTSKATESDRQRVVALSSTSQQPNVDRRIIGNPKQRQEFQVTSFEAPNPRNLHTPLTTYDLATRVITNDQSTNNSSVSNNPKLYQNVPFVPGTNGTFGASVGRNTLRMFYESSREKVPAQTQTSIDDGSSHENEIAELIVNSTKISDSETRSNHDSPTSTRRKRTVRKERGVKKVDKRPLSPAAQRRRLRKQSSIDTIDGTVERKKIANKIRQLSPAMTNTTTTTTSEHAEEKNESRSSSSGQDSPRKERNRRVSMYFNSKKRSSVASVKTTKSFSNDNVRDNFRTRTIGETVETTNSERERTNSASSREATGGKARKSSVSSGKVPWCACWGNGCV